MPRLSVKSTSSLGNRLSQIGSYASLACAIQCALTPIVILALPFLTTHISSEWHAVLSSILGETTEWFFIGVICLFGGFGLLTTYSIHQDKRPAYLSVLGLFFAVREIRDGSPKRRRNRDGYHRCELHRGGRILESSFMPMLQLQE